MLTAIELRPEDRFQKMEQMRDELLKIRELLDQPARQLYFFDTSTLMEVVCPPIPTSRGRIKARRARNQFEVQHLNQSAVTSAGVIAEVLTQIVKLYFEATERGPDNDTHVQSVVGDAKDKIRHRRRRRGMPESFSWDDLTWEKQVDFLAQTKGLYEARLCGITSQLHAINTDTSIVVQEFLRFSLHSRLPERDFRILAEALATSAAWFHSEESRYRTIPYRSVLKHIGANLFEINRNPDFPSKVSEAEGVPTPSHQHIDSQKVTSIMDGN